MKPRILQLNPILIPAINDKLAALFTVHKHFETRDPNAWLREHGESISALITGGHTGASRAMLDVGTFTTTAMVCPFSLQWRSAASVSAVSPDWEMNSARPPSSNTGSR